MYGMYRPHAPAPPSHGMVKWGAAPAILGVRTGAMLKQPSAHGGVLAEGLRWTGAVGQARPSADNGGPGPTKPATEEVKKRFSSAPWTINASIAGVIDCDVVADLFCLKSFQRPKGGESKYKV